MQQYYLGVDVSKGYADFVILDSNKQPIKENFHFRCSACPSQNEINSSGCNNKLWESLLFSPG